MGPGVQLSGTHLPGKHEVISLIPDTKKVGEGIFITCENSQSSLVGD